MYAWKMGLKTGQYYLRSRPARDAIQFTLDLDAVENNIVKNKTQAELDAEKRQKKKRSHDQMTSKPIVSESVDLNKKRKLTENVPEGSKTEDKSATAVDTTEAAKEEKPWENKPEEEEDYRWAVCENCQ